MYRLFAVIGIALILLGVALFAMPSISPTVETMRRSPAPPTSIISQLLTLADRYNAPLSILFGAMSLYYSRKRYLVERDKAAEHNQT